jgi:hypothetical protein
VPLFSLHDTVPRKSNILAIGAHLPEEEKINENSSMIKKKANRFTLVTLMDDFRLRYS